jgi:hypothetical protein
MLLLCNGVFQTDLNTWNNFSGDTSGSPKGPEAKDENTERFEGMEALEADVRDTLNRFDKLNHAMDHLFQEANNS